MQPAGVERRPAREIVGPHLVHHEDNREAWFGRCFLATSDGDSGSEYQRCSNSEQRQPEQMSFHWYILYQSLTNNPMYNPIIVIAE